MLKKYPWVVIAVRNGLISGAVGMAMLLGLYFMGRHPFLIPPYLDFRIILFGVMLFFTLKEFRDYSQGGILYFWQGMFMSMVFTAVFALVGFVVIWIFSVLRPEFLSSFIAQKMEELKLIPAEIVKRIGQEDFDRVAKALPATRGFDLAYLYFWQSFGISFFVSVIISVILRRQPKPKP
jgi:Protein of unknown function (DUF4199)